jgi:hypothetical protein
MTVIALIPCLSLGLFGLALVPDYSPPLARAARSVGTTAIAAAMFLVGVIANPIGTVTVVEDPYELDHAEAEWFTE